jgi:hypothetical protein
LNFKRSFDILFEMFMEAMMQAPIFQMVRSGLRVLTQKLAIEILVSSVATLLVMAMFSSVMKATPPSLGAVAANVVAAPAGGSGDKTADFIEQVALSHVAGLKPAPAAANPAATPTNTTAAGTPAAVPPAPAHTAAARPHDRQVAVHVAAADVLPPPRPSFAASEPVVIPAIVPAVVAVPAKPKRIAPLEYGLRPLRYGMHLVTSAVDFVPATGTRVVEGVASVGDALSSFAKKL